MRFFGGITLFFYTLIILMMGLFFIIVAINVIPLTYMIETLGTIYSNIDVRLILGVTEALTSADFSDSTPLATKETR